MNRVFFQITLAMTLLLSGCLAFRIEKNPTAAKPTFESLNRAIFSTKCASCHSGTNPPHGINLTSYKMIMDSAVFPPLVIPGKPEQSAIYQSCISGQMPKYAAKLSASELSALYFWIKNGATEVESEVSPPTPSPTPSEPGEVRSQEPCDPMKISNEPGIQQCSSEPTDD